jgi:hypothetical protein
MAMGYWGRLQGALDAAPADDETARELKALITAASMCYSHPTEVFGQCL